MERLRSRTKSMMVMQEARKSFLVAQRDGPLPVDPVLAAGGTSPSPGLMKSSKSSVIPSVADVIPENPASGAAGPHHGGPLSAIFSGMVVASDFNGTSVNGGGGGGRRSTMFSSTSAHQHHQPSLSAADNTAVASPSFLLRGEEGSMAGEEGQLPGGGADAFAAFHHQNNNHQHAFSQRYQEHTIEEYQEVMGQFSKAKWGGLGPEDNEEKQKAREVRRRVQEYGKCVSQLNIQLVKSTALPPLTSQIDGTHPNSGSSVGGAGGPLLPSLPQLSTSPTPSHAHQQRIPPPSGAKETELARLKRERALKFADHLRGGNGKSLDKHPTRSTTGSTSPVPRKAVGAAARTVEQPPPTLNGGEDGTSAADPLAVLRDMERRHKQDLEKIVAIKRQLGLIDDDTVSSSSPATAAIGNSHLLLSAQDGPEVGGECSNDDMPPHDAIAPL